MGLPVTKNVLAKTKPECAAKLAQLRKTPKELVPDQPKPGILLADWLDLWYQGYKKPNLRPNTQPSYERRIYQHTIPAFGGTQLDKLTPADIQEFYVSLKKGGQLIHTELYKRSEASILPSTPLWTRSWRKTRSSEIFRRDTSFPLPSQEK